jgi:ABC-type multidrug transport system fused ATPase/permease subunit
VLDKGRIVDEGSFDELLAKSAVFLELWDHQKGQAVIQPFE